jgi:localization factor PodJL
MHDLGVYFAHGEGAPQDAATAFLYERGSGVNANPGEALFWFMLAARQGDEGARARVAVLERTLSPLAVEQARARALAFHPRQADPAANVETASHTR